jgi:hypothetical protein
MNDKDNADKIKQKLQKNDKKMEVENGFFR